MESKRGRAARATGNVVLAVLTMGAAMDAAGQTTSPDFVPPVAGTWEPVASLGQPPRWKPYFGVGFGVEDLIDAGRVGTTGLLGVYRDLMHPLYGLGLSAEAYMGHRAQQFDGGGRAYVSARSLFLHAGVDWNARRGGDFILTATIPPTRGGWFGQGGEVRIDWIPRRDQSLTVGVQVPLAQPLAGRTRPRQVDVPLPRPAVRRPVRVPADHVALNELAELRRSQNWVMMLHNIFWLTEPRGVLQGDYIGRTRTVMDALRRELVVRDSILPDRNTWAREIGHYHRMLDRAFGLALGAAHHDAGRAGRAVADEARRIALAEVILPYNRTIGQYKKPDTLLGLIARARVRFRSHLEIERTPGRDVEPALQVFDAWLAGFEELRADLATLTQDSRMHWLPLPFVLRPEQHDSQADIDAIIEAAIGRPFHDGNAIHYINAPQFQVELERTIREAERYHVLWIHDYRGWNELDMPDRVGYMQTRAYLRALLAHVRGYDETGRIPIYILMLDQHSYELNKGGLWLDVLERPLDHTPRLPDTHAEMRRQLLALRDSLQAAVAGSKRMAIEAEAFGRDWSRRIVKVHVNVTNPSDFTFRSGRLLGLSIGADNLMRDHRKIVIRDVDETDPTSGEVILSGVGVGEKYTAVTWEDRAIMIQGPAALHARDMAREVLEIHDLGGAAMPPPLRPAAGVSPAGNGAGGGIAAGAAGGSAAERVDGLARNGVGLARVMQAHNRTGWGDKEATFVQMLLYDLAPAGTVLYVPSSLWNSYEWLAQLVGAALRGCRVFIVAPARDHAPSAGFPQVSAMQELITRLVVVQEGLLPFIEDAGGELHVGLYTRRAPVDDLSARIAEADSAFGEHEFLNRLFPLSEEAWEVLRRFRDLPPGDGPGLIDDARGRPPMLHRKTQLIASGRLLSDMAGTRGLPDVLDDLLAAERETVTVESESGPLIAQRRLEPALSLLNLHASLPVSSRNGNVAWFMTGSLNKDVRGMALDGEALAVVAGEWALQAWLDFFLLSGGVTWVRTVEEAHALLPPLTPVRRVIGRLLHRVL